MTGAFAYLISGICGCWSIWLQQDIASFSSDSELIPQIDIDLLEFGWLTKSLYTSWD